MIIIIDNRISNELLLELLFILAFVCVCVCVVVQFRLFANCPLIIIYYTADKRHHGITGTAAKSYLLISIITKWIRN